MILYPILIFLALGSYLNSLAHRLIHLDDFFKIRSFCPSCKKTIAWYDNIPLFSWLYLRARCRSCKQSISWLYPFIELITTVTLFLLWQKYAHQYFFIYAVFFSALIITIRTDFDQMLISRFATLYIIPIGFFAAAMDLLPLTMKMSFMGAIFGYGLLWTTKKISFHMTNQECLGEGDLELLAMIGAYTGPFGCWIALLVGSVFGTIVSIIYMITTQQKIMLIPLGAYLSFGAITFVLWQDFFIKLYQL